MPAFAAGGALAWNSKIKQVCPVCERWSDPSKSIPDFYHLILSHWKSLANIYHQKIFFFKLVYTFAGERNIIPSESSERTRVSRRGGRDRTRSPKFDPGS